METFPVCEGLTLLPHCLVLGSLPARLSLTQHSLSCSYKGMNHPTSGLKFTLDLFLRQDEFVISVQMCFIELLGPSETHWKA